MRLRPQIGLLEEIDVVHIRYYHIGEFESLGLVNGNHPHGIFCGRGCNFHGFVVLIAFCPGLQEVLEPVAVVGSPVLHPVHKGLDVGGVGIHQLGILALEGPDDFFRKRKKRRLSLARNEADGTGKISGSLILRVFHRSQH